MDVEIDSAGSSVPAVLEIPAGVGPWPGVVIVHDLAGLTADTRNIARRVAANGFVTIAPDLYSRGRRVRCMVTVMREMLAGRGDAVHDILAARDRLRAHSLCTGDIGVAGFCLGGGFALVMSSKGFGAAAPFYPSIPPRYDTLLDDACPIVASYGRRDPLNVGNAEKLRVSAMKKGIAHDIKTYPEAGHSFANEIPGQSLARIVGFGYDAEATDDAFERVYSFFRQHLDTAWTGDGRAEPSQETHDHRNS